MGWVLLYVYRCCGGFVIMVLDLFVFLWFVWGMVFAGFSLYFGLVSFWVWVVVFNSSCG